MELDQRRLFGHVTLEKFAAERTAVQCNSSIKEDITTEAAALVLDGSSLLCK